MTFGDSVVDLPLTYSRQRPARSSSIFQISPRGPGDSYVFTETARRAWDAADKAGYMQVEHARNKKAGISRERLKFIAFSHFYLCCCR